MQELHARDVSVTDSFWSPRLAVNSQKAIFHQWDQLEATGCIDNLRIAVGEKDGPSANRLRQSGILSALDIWKPPWPCWSGKSLIAFSWQRWSKPGSVW